LSTEYRIGNFKVVVADDEAEFDRLAADEVTRLLQQKPEAVLGLPTGSTPVGLYAELRKRYREGRISLRAATSFNLDEYVGLAPEHPQSYHAFMQEHLFGGIDLPKERTFLPEGIGDPQLAAARYEELLAKYGPIDLMILGIGRNGHIGFNEPGTSFKSGVHPAMLTQSTIKANARFFASEDEVPKQAITMGIGNILAARRIMLLAKGASKAQAIRATVCGEMSEQVPASALQSHPDVLLILDREAAALLVADQEAGASCRIG